MQTETLRDWVETAVEIAGNVDEQVREQVVTALIESLRDAQLEGALQRHMRDVGEQAEQRWRSTTATVSAALDHIDPKLRNRRTAGIIMAGNQFALDQEGPGHSQVVGSLRMKREGLWGFAFPGMAPAIDTTDLVNFPVQSLSVARLTALWSGNTFEEMPSRPYIGAGYDADGNVDLVFLAWAFGPTYAAGERGLAPKALQARIHDWISRLHHNASQGIGPYSLVRLYERRNARGLGQALLQDSHTIAEAAWMEILTDQPGERTVDDVVQFLDGRQFVQARCPHGHGNM